MVLAHLLTPRADSESEIAARAEAWTPGAGFMRKTTSGETINSAKAMTYSTWFACIRNISEDIARLRLGVYRSTDTGGDTLDPKHPLYRMLRLIPNPEMTSSVFRELMNGWAMGWGNAFAEIERDGGGRIVALWPIHPSRCYLHRVDGRIVLDVFASDSLGMGRAVRLEYAEVLHIRGFGDDPLCGLSMIRLAAESIGVALAAQTYGATFFANGALASLVLIHPNKLKENEQTNLRESWKKRVSGTNKNGVAVLWDGIKIERMSVPPEEAQFLETRQFQVAEIARWFRMPPHMVQDLSRSTNNNIEHQSIEYVTRTLAPWLNRWSQECERKLLDEREWETHEIKHDLRPLLLGDSKSRAEYMAKLLASGLMTINEGRLMEGMNPDPSPAANLLWMQGAMRPIEVLAVAPATSGAQPANDEPNKEDPPAEPTAPTEDDQP